jgi:2-polyprenyl-3-methyl-5-hydroxy-6-metoxy-1,4-benzoquinol methylase
MDTETWTFYADRAFACASQYEQADVRALHDVLRLLAKKHARVLEVGGGSGRDTVFMAELGCDATYTDGCSKMVDQAVRLHPELAKNARIAAFPLSEDDDLLGERFDLVLCIAVIMHLDDACLDHLASQLATVIPFGGHLVLSHSSGRQGLTANRDAIGRLCCERSATAVAQIFEALGFEVKRQTEDSDGMGRRSISWMTQVFQKMA